MDSTKMADSVNGTLQRVACVYFSKIKGSVTIGKKSI